MKVCILGWYGTETLGDRAILDGIFYLMDKAFGNFSVSIGSLNPNFTKRTIIEDGGIYSATAPSMDLKYFDAKSINELTNEIKTSDLVIMGGGPIMHDIGEIFVVYKGFKIARKYGIRTMIVGCGLGPLNKQNYINIVDKLFSVSDLIIFRDETSCFTAKQLFGEKYLYYFSQDPAILSVGNYLNTNRKEFIRADTIAINLREFPTGTYGNVSYLSIETLRTIIEELSYEFDSVLLVPMHTYFIGGDDRKYLTEIAYNINRTNVRVVHETMNLYDLYRVFQESYACIGMRYHSVVFQTLLNGNNIIFDYTSKHSGKVLSFIKMIDKEGFYKDRYLNIQEPVNDDLWRKIRLLKDRKRFEYIDKIFSETADFYISRIYQVLK